MRRSSIAKRQSSAPSLPRPPRMRSPRPATTSLPPTRTAAFIAFLHGVALAEILAATARASCPVVTPRDPRGGYPRGPCCRRSRCGPGGCDTRGLLHGSRAAPSHAEMQRWRFAAQQPRPQRAEQRGEGAQGTRPTGTSRAERWKNARAAADQDAQRGEVEERDERGRVERVDARWWRAARVAAGRSASERSGIARLQPSSRIAESAARPPRTASASPKAASRVYKTAQRDCKSALRDCEVASRPREVPSRARDVALRVGEVSMRGREVTTWASGT